MAIEQIRQARRKRPFEPFKIGLSDGRSVPVKHPDFIAFSRDIVVVIDESGYGATNIDPLLIVSVEFDSKNAG